LFSGEQSLQAFYCRLLSNKKMQMMALSFSATQQTPNRYDHHFFEVSEKKAIFCSMCFYDIQWKDVVCV
jgi:hypothetical protein